jgi:hypothetical protein
VCRARSRCSRGWRSRARRESSTLRGLACRPSRVSPSSRTAKASRHRPRGSRRNPAARPAWDMSRFVFPCLFPAMVRGAGVKPKLRNMPTRRHLLDSRRQGFQTATFGRSGAIACFPDSGSSLAGPRHPALSRALGVRKCSVARCHPIGRGCSIPAVAARPFGWVRAGCSQLAPSLLEDRSGERSAFFGFDAAIESR